MYEITPLIKLPLKSTEKGVLRTLAYHCNKSQNNLCIPSWDTLIAESGVSRGIINKILTIACDVGIIDKKSRADIGTGKQPNEYFFLFEDIYFYGRGSQIRLSEANKKRFKLKIEAARKRFKENELLKRKGKNKPPISSDMNYPINASTDTYHKPQKFRDELSDLQGQREGTISTTGEPINASTDTVSIEASVCSSKISASLSNCDTTEKIKTSHQESKVNPLQDLNDSALIEKKTVLHEKDMNTLQEKTKPKMKRVIA